MELAMVVPFSTENLSTRSMTGDWVRRAVMVVLMFSSRSYRSSRWRPFTRTPLGMLAIWRLALLK